MLGVGKFEAMWQGPYIVSRIFEKGAYELVDYNGIPFSEPRNGLYLKEVLCLRSHVHECLYFIVSYSLCVTVVSFFVISSLPSTTYVTLCLVSRC
jgi:hypothetical protein